MKQIITRTLLLFAAAAFAVVISTASCSRPAAVEPGERAAGQFHRQFNAGQYREIYQQSGKQFQYAGNEAEFIGFLENVRRKLGAFESASGPSWRVRSTPAETVVTLTYNTQFTEGSGTERFLFLIDGDRAILLDYNVVSPFHLP